MTNITLPDWPWRTICRLADERRQPIWLVGGAVRDALLARPVHDWDFATEQEAMGLARAAADALGGAYFPLDKERDTGRIVLTASTGARLELDFAALREVDLEGDLRARDFTINAMALDAAGRLFDPTGGQSDLEANLIRAVSEGAFRSDPVRLLRAVRLEAQLGFEIEPQTAAWIHRDADKAAIPSAERMRDEFARMLISPKAVMPLQRLDEFGLLPYIAPELRPLKEVAQSPPHRFDVWRHTLLTVDALEGVVAAIVGQEVESRPLVNVPPAAWDNLARELGQFADDLTAHLSIEVSSGRDRTGLLKLAALLHDIGKPQTQSQDSEGRIHFYEHEPMGARMASARLKKLRFSRDEAKCVYTIIEQHLRPAHLSRAKKVTRRAVYRYFRVADRAGIDAALLSLADHLATWGPNLREQCWRRQIEVVKILLTHYFKRREETIAPPPLVTGNDLMITLELEEGPEIGRLLEELQESQAAGEVQTREEALALAAQTHASRLLDNPH